MLIIFRPRTRGRPGEGIRSPSAHWGSVLAKQIPYHISEGIEGHAVGAVELLERSMVTIHHGPAAG